MPDIDGLVQSTLEMLGTPVSRLFYKGDETTYITFQRILGRENAFADDDGTAYEHYFRCDIYSRDNYTELLKGTLKALKDAGFYGITVNAELYEHDSGFFHISVDFEYMEVKQWQQ